MFASIAEKNLHIGECAKYLALSISEALYLLLRFLTKVIYDEVISDHVRCHGTYSSIVLRREEGAYLQSGYGDRPKVDIENLYVG